MNDDVAIENMYSAMFHL